MNRNFSQMITVQCSDPAPMLELLAEWDLQQATGASWVTWERASSPTEKRWAGT